VWVLRKNDIVTNTERRKKLRSKRTKQCEKWTREEIKQHHSTSKRRESSYNHHIYPQRSILWRHSSD